MPTEIQYVTCEDGGKGTGEWSATTLTCEGNTMTLLVQFEVIICLLWVCLFSYELLTLLEEVLFVCMFFPGPRYINLW